MLLALSVESMQLIRIIGLRTMERGQGMSRLRLKIFKIESDCAGLVGCCGRLCIRVDCHDALGLKHVTK